MKKFSNTGDSNSWITEWEEQDQSWNIEAGIDTDRQRTLEKLLAEAASNDQGKHPFNRFPLKRNDVEWLLAKYISGYKATFDCYEQSGQLDLSGAILRKIDLHKLPLANIDLSGARLEGADLRETDLQGADLSEAHLEHADLNFAILKETHLKGAWLNGANLNNANLGNAYLNGAHLNGANLNGANLENADLHGAYLEAATLHETNLKGADLHEAHLQRTNVQEAHLEEAYLSEANLEEAYFNEVSMERADLHGAYLKGATLHKSHLQEAILHGADLERVTFNHTHLEGANLEGAKLGGCDFRKVFFSSSTNLSHVILGNSTTGFVSLAGVRWGDVDLSVVDWGQMKILGDEYQARQSKTSQGKVKDISIQLNEYREAVRAYRQLAIVLESQGLNEHAVHFAHRAHVLQRVVMRQRKEIPQYLFSLFLDLLAGYGYKPMRSLIAYLVVIFGFMGLYLLNAHFVIPHLRWDEALVLSLSSFHGRGFFSQNITLGDTYARLAAAEAVMGLIIEVSLIATWTQRFFGK